MGFKEWAEKNKAGSPGQLAKKEERVQKRANLKADWATQKAERVAKKDAGADGGFRSASPRGGGVIMTNSAGWFPQPDGQQRYWDGEQWTEHFAPGALPPSVTLSAVLPPPVAPPGQVPPPVTPPGGIPGGKPTRPWFKKKRFILPAGAPGRSFGEHKSQLTKSEEPVNAGNAFRGLSSDPVPIASYLHVGAREMRITDITAAAPRWALTTGTLITVAALAACSTSSNQATPPSSNNSGKTTGVTVQLTSAELAVNLKSTSNVTSAHITMSSTLGSQTVLTAQGDETAAGGKLTAMNLNEQIGSSNMTILLTGGTLYVKLPGTLNKSGQPWEKATAGSSNPVLRQLASTLSTIEQSASLDQYGSMAQAASSLKTIGTEQVNGAVATHYSLMVDVSKIHGAAFTQAAKAALAQARITKIPVDVWVDTHNRPVKMSEKFTVKGQTVSFTATIGRYNQPVTITAPPTSQVSTK